MKMKNFMKKMKKLSIILCICMIACCTAAEAASVTIKSGTPVFTADEMFTARDLENEPDLDGAVYLTAVSGSDITVTEEGVYVLSGTAENVTVYVEADDEDKVQLVLAGLNVTNADFPVIYVKSADKVFLTVTEDSALNVTGAFRQDGSTNTDGVIFCKSDLTLNGTAALTVSSSENGIVCKDDLRVTGGTYVVSAYDTAFEANDSIRIADGVFSIAAVNDGLHAENDDDATLGHICIFGGSIGINAGDDGIHGTGVVQIDGGTISISAAEGIEGTYIQINGGTISISASDDGINAAQKTKAYVAAIELNGGEITVSMGPGDTDGIDSNGNIIVNGGTVSVTGNSTFDCDGTAQYNGGTVIVNGQTVSYIPTQNLGFGRQGNRQGFGR